MQVAEAVPNRQHDFGKREDEDMSQRGGASVYTLE